MTRELKGYHVLIIALMAFAVIIAANLTMLFAATGSFPGLVVKNSYVASQGWNDRTAEQKALGWTSDVTYANGTVKVALSTPAGAPVQDAVLNIVIGRPATDTMDQSFDVQGTSPYLVPADLAQGKWLIQIRSDGDAPFRTTAALFVPDAR